MTRAWGASKPVLQSISDILRLVADNTAVQTVQYSCVELPCYAGAVRAGIASARRARYVETLHSRSVGLK